MNSTLLKEIIIRQNQRFKPKNNLVNREIFERVKSFIDIPHIVVISGLRRVGKSTLLSQIKEHFYKNLENVYLSFEDEKLLDFNVNDFDLLFENFLVLNNFAKVYFFDEIQNINGFEIAIRRLYDEGYKFFISGSNASLLSKELGSKFTGRYVKIELYPFSFKELLDFYNEEIDENYIYLPENRAKLKKFFDDYLLNGGMPEYVKYKNYEIIKQVYEDIIYKDILVRYNITDDKSFRQLSRYLISNMTKEFSYNKLKSLLGFGSVNTVKSYINFLENSYLLFQVEKFDYSLKKQILSNKKIYCIDNAFYDVVGFNFSQNNGQKLENLVFVELKRSGYEVYYHKAKKECDFLVFDRGKIIQAIQVCLSLYDADTKNREISGLLEAMDMWGINNGTILTNDEEETIEIKGKTINVLPVWKRLLK